MTSAIIESLLGNLAELDAQGLNIAAAHVDAAIQELIRSASLALDLSKMDGNISE